MTDSFKKINPQKLRRLERKYNVRIGVCADMGGVKANAIYTPRGSLFVMYQPDATEADVRRAAAGGSRLFRGRQALPNLRARTLHDLLNGYLAPGARVSTARWDAIARDALAKLDGGAA
jgi:hypothetical protein